METGVHRLQMALLVLLTPLMDGLLNAIDACRAGTSFAARRDYIISYLKPHPILLCHHREDAWRES